MSGSDISWAICKSAPRSRQITMPAPHHSVFYRPDALPAAQPTASEHWRHWHWCEFLYVHLVIYVDAQALYRVLELWPTRLFTRPRWPGLVRLFVLASAAIRSTEQTSSTVSRFSSMTQTPTVRMFKFMFRGCTHTRTHLIIIIKGIYIAQVRKGQKCAMSAEMAVWLCSLTVYVFIAIYIIALCPGLPRWASTRKVKPIWILLKQETVSGSGISSAVCKSAPRSRQINTPAPHHSVSFRPDALPAAQPTASEHWRLEYS